LVNIQPGDVIFYKPSGLIGWVISKITKSPYSHVAIAVDSDTILESNRFITTRLANIEKGKKVYHVYRLNGVTEIQQRDIVEHSMTTLGTKYDYLQILGLFFRYVFRLNYLSFNQHNKFICSENIDYAFLMSNIPRRDLQNLLDISPQELFEKYDLKRVLLTG
jgi:uncharacterized protein YycO